MRIARSPTGALAFGVAIYVVARLLFYISANKFSTTPVDEVLAVFLIPFFPVGIVLLLRQSYGLTVTVSALFYLLTIGISSLVAPYSLERGHNVLFSGLMFEIKPFIIFFGLYFFAFRSYRSGNIQSSLQFIYYTLMAIAVLDIPFVLHDLFAGHDVFGDRLALRGGFYRPNGLLRHPVTNAQQLLFSLVAAVAMLRMRFRIWVLAVAVATFAMIIVSLQVKESIAACFVVMTYPFLGKRFSASMLPLGALSLIALASAALLAPAENPVTAHFSASLGSDGDETVRSAMYAAAPRIAVDNFPFGSGVSSFGSEGSRMDGYSSVYKRYGIWGLWGANYANDRYLLDTFWPKILGESGFIGLCAFALFFLSGLFRSVSRLQREKSPIMYFAFLIICVTLILSSAMQPFNEELAGLMFALALACTFLPRIVRGQDRPDLSE